MSDQHFFVEKLYKCVFNSTIYISAHYFWYFRKLFLQKNCERGALFRVRFYIGLEYDSDIAICSAADGSYPAAVE